MNVMEYAEGVEKLVDPMMVGQSHYMQTRLRKLPVWLQRKIVTSATKTADKMPFVVEPYCSFLFYEIPNPEKVQRFMPDGFLPARSAIFQGDMEKYYGIVSMFRIHTSVFWGARAEYYLVAENTKTGLLSWVMMDYISDSISYDEKHGLKSPDVREAIMTTTCEGDFICKMKSLEQKRAEMDEKLNAMTDEEREEWFNTHKPDHGTPPELDDETKAMLDAMTDEERKEWFESHRPEHTESASNTDATE